MKYTLILLVLIALSILYATPTVCADGGVDSAVYELPRVLVVYDDYEVNLTRPGLPSRTAIMINYVAPVAYSLMSQLPGDLDDYNIIIFDTSIGEYAGVSQEYVNLIAKTIEDGKPVIILGRGFTKEQVSLLSNITGMFFEVAGKYSMSYYVKPELTVHPGITASITSDKMDRDIWYAVNLVLSKPNVEPIIDIGGGYALAARYESTIVILLSVDDTAILRDDEFWANLLYGLLGAQKPWPRIPAFFDYATTSPCESAVVLAFHDYPTKTELDVIEKYHYTVSMFFISGFYGIWSGLLPRVQRLVKMNLIDIIPHSLKHADMKSDRDALTDLVLSRKIFLELFGKDYVMMAPPGANQTQIQFYEKHVGDVNPYVAVHPVRGYAFIYYVDGVEHIGSPSGPIPTLVGDKENPLYSNLQRLMEIVDENLAYHRTIVIDVHPEESEEIYWPDIMERFIPLLLARNVCPLTMSEFIQYGWDRHLVHVRVRMVGDTYAVELSSREPVIVPLVFNEPVESVVDESGRVLAWVVDNVVVTYVDGEKTLIVKTGTPRIGPITGVSPDLPSRPLVEAYISGNEVIVTVHDDPRIIGNYSVRIRIGTAETIIPEEKTMYFNFPGFTFYNITLLTYDGVPVSYTRIHVAGSPTLLETDGEGRFTAYLPSFVDVYAVLGGKKYELTNKNGTIKLDVVKILFPNTLVRIPDSRYTCYSVCYLPRETVRVYTITYTSKAFHILDLAGAKSNTLYTEYIVKPGVHGDPGSITVLLAMVFGAVFFGVTRRFK